MDRLHRTSPLRAIRRLLEIYLKPVPMVHTNSHDGFVSNERIKGLAREATALDNVAHNVSHCLLMRSFNMRQLRDTKRLKALLRAGKTIELCDRNKRIGRIVPENHDRPDVKWPDFEALAKEIIGDRVLPGADLLIEERGRY